MAKVFHVRAPKTMTLGKMQEAEISRFVEAEAGKTLDQFPSAVRPVGYNAVTMSQLPTADFGAWAQWSRACCDRRKDIDDYSDPIREELELETAQIRPTRGHIESHFAVQELVRKEMHKKDTE